MSPTARSSRPSLFAHLFLATLGAVLLLSAAPFYQASAVANITRAALILVFLVAGLVRRKAVFQAWSALSPVTLLAALVWLTVMGLAVARSPLPRVAMEYAIGEVWPLLTGAFVYAFAARGKIALRLVVNSLLVFADLALLLCLLGERTAFFGGDLYFVLCLTPLLPLAIWEARHHRDARDNSQKNRQRPRFWRWRSVRPYVGLLALATALPSLSALHGFGNIWPGVRALLATWPAAGPGSMQFFLPQYLPTNAPRLPAGIAPGWFTQTLAEQGPIALPVMLVFIASLLIGRSPEKPQLHNAARGGALLFLTISLFVSPAGALLPQVIFYALLAVAAAQTQPRSARPDNSTKQSASKTLVSLVIGGSLVFAFWRLPFAIGQAQALWFYERTFGIHERDAQLKFITLALHHDPAQSAYWMRLADLRLQHDGSPASRAAANYLRAALFRAGPQIESPDAALWHRMALLSLGIGDAERSALLARKAVQYDPACGIYRATLAEALRQVGDDSSAAREAALASEFSHISAGQSPLRYRRRFASD